MFQHLKNSKAFTLVEMLIVIGILAVLVAVVVSILNPAEFFRQTRDSRRLSDLNQLDQALNLATLDNVFMGAANVVYVSIPDDSGGVTVTTTCSTLGLPAIPGWTYQCSNSTNYRKVNGLGWVPINFTALVTVPSALTLLPVDPTNSTSTNLFYTYVSGSWELTSLFESTKYTNQYHGFGTSTVYTSGNHQGLSPNGIAMRAGTGGGGGSSATVPTAPQSLTTATSSQQIILGWSAPSSNGGASITSYKVYRGTTSNGETLLSSGGCSSLGNVLTCTDTGLTNGTPYYYKVSAVNSVGEGTKSSEVSATPATAALTAHTFTTSGTWTAPAGVTSVQIECYGAGGGGGSKSAMTGFGGGGGGGAYAKVNAFAVTSGNNYSFVVGTKGTFVTGDYDGNPGGNTTFNTTTCIAEGGKGGKEQALGLGVGGAAGLAANSTGNVKYNGGAGGTSSAPPTGGGGGSSAGTAGDGNTGSTPTGGVAPMGGYAGSNGGATGHAGDDNASTNYGGGGGGTGGPANSGVATNGGNGTGGLIILTY